MTDIAALRELDRANRKRTQREWSLIAAILVIGIMVALLVGHEITSANDDVRSIKCEEGDVTLIIERAGGLLERVECPAGSEVTP